MATAANL